MGAVLITRPEPGASDTAARLASLGYASIIAPFLQIEQLHPRLPRRAQACLITSANAIHCLPSGIPIFAVGDATAARARAVTSFPVHSAAADATALAALVALTCTPAQGPLLLLSGHRQGLTLAAELRMHGFQVTRRTVYRAISPRIFPPNAAQAIRAHIVDRVLFFSPETARAFVRLAPVSLRPELSQIKALTLSPAISRAVADLPWRSITTAEHPTQEMLMRLL